MFFPVDANHPDIASFNAYIATHLARYTALRDAGHLFCLTIDGTRYCRDDGPLIGYYAYEERLYYYDVDFGVRANTVANRNTYNTKDYKALSIFGELDGVITNMEASCQNTANDQEGGSNS